MRRAAASAAFAALLCASLAGGCRASGACREGEAFCFCPKGASCTQACGVAAGCSLACANGNVACALAAGDRCTATCQNAQRCDATCGADSTVACQYVSGSCRATVGERSVVRCEGAASCDVTCNGSCDVDCPDGRCRVRCAGPAAGCSLSCGKGGPAATCPDSAVHTCGGAPC